MNTALIDGDILLYQAANRVEEAFDWGDDLWSVAADLNEAKGHFLSKIAEIEKDVVGDAVVCLSDPRGTFRHEMFGEYKANRAGRKPLVFKALRDWVTEKMAVIFPKLEADDVLGIYATAGIVRSPVIVTIDKDLKSVPGRHYNPSRPDEGIVTVGHQEAEEFHLIQTLSGDATDNYKGVPGIGPVKARRLLEKEGFTWSTVVAAFEKAGLTEGEALLNARMAKILTAEQWDFESETVIPWTPNEELV